MPTFSRVLVNIPTKTRAGFSASLITLLMGVFVFFLSFQKFLFIPQYSITENCYFDESILDIYVLLTFPCTLMFIFMVSQVRVRLGWHCCNFWSILHLIIAVLTIFVSVMYIIARPERTLAGMNGSVNAEESWII